MLFALVVLVPRGFVDVFCTSRASWRPLRDVLRAIACNTSFRLLYLIIIGIAFTIKLYSLSSPSNTQIFFALLLYYIC